MKEILKVLTPLYKALRDSENKELDDDDDTDYQYRYAMTDDVMISELPLSMWGLVFCRSERWKMLGYSVRRLRKKVLIYMNY